MVKMHKLTKGGQTIYPATIYDAVVNPKTRKSLTTEISELESSLNGGDAGYINLNIQSWVTGQWTGEGSSLTHNDNSSYKRNTEVSTLIKSGAILTMYEASGKQVKMNDYGITFKFRGSAKNKAEWSWYDSGNGILIGNTDAVEIYMTVETSNVEFLNGFVIKGAYVKGAEDKISELTESVESLEQSTTDNIEHIFNIDESVNGGNVGRIYINEDDLVTGRWTGEGKNLKADSMEGYLRTKNLYDITLKAGDLISVYDKAGKQVKANSLGLNMKFKNSTNTSSIISYQDSGTYYKLTEDAMQMAFLGTSEAVEKITGYYFKGFRIKGFDEKISDVNESIHKHNNDVKITDFYHSLKILFIGSSFGVDTINYVGDIAHSYNFNIVIGNLYVGASRI